MQVIHNLMKCMLDKVEKDERKSAKRKRKEEQREGKRQKGVEQKRMMMLQKQKENLRNEIMIRRTLLEKKLTWDVRVKIVVCLYIMSGL